VRRSVAVAEGEVTSAAGDLIAKAVGTFGVRRQS
jgi:acyl-coenzyme A thioesterase PaaI-like protein